MTYLELINKMRNELANYQVGLHNISSEKFQNVISHHDRWYNIFIFDSDEFTEEAIAKQILKTGLKVRETGCGLRSTVTFLDALTDTCLDYNYNAINDIVTNIIVAIPPYIPYEGKEYYIGDLRESVNIGNMLIFSPLLISEFIYGYYSRKIVSKIIDSYGYCINYTYDDHLNFSENPIHFAKQTLLEQKETIKKLLKLRRHSLKYLRLASNNQLLPLIFLPSARFFIKETRRQNQKLILKKP